MTTSNYKSTIGGAFSATGITLLGVGIVPQLGGTPSKVLTAFAIVGFIFTAVGTFLGHLFAADAKTVADLSDKVDANKRGIDAVPLAISTGDTSIIKKAVAEVPPVNPPVAPVNTTP